AISNWDRLSDSLDAAGLRAWRAPRVPVLERRICRADSRVGGEQAARLFDFGRTARHGRDVSLRPHPYASHRRPVFSGAGCGIRAHSASERSHAVDRHFALPESNVAGWVLAALVGRDRSPDSPAGLSTYQATLGSQWIASSTAISPFGREGHELQDRKS